MSETVNTQPAPVAETPQVAASTPAPAASAAPAAVEQTPAEKAPEPFIKVAADEVKKDDKPAEVKPETKAEEKDYDIKLQDGFKADEKILGNFKKLAKEAGLSNEIVQKMVDFEAARTKAAAEANEQQMKALWEANNKAIETDKELGGAKLQETRAIVGKVLKDITSGLPKESQDAIGQLFNTPIGSDLHVVRLLTQIHNKYMREDVPSLGDTTAGTPENRITSDMSLYDMVRVSGLSK